MLTRFSAGVLIPAGMTLTAAAMVYVKRLGVQASYPAEILDRKQYSFDAPCKIAEEDHCEAHLGSAFERAAAITGRPNEVGAADVHLELSIRSLNLEELKASFRWLEQPETKSRFDEIPRVL